MEHGASGEQRAPLPTDRARGSGGDAWIPILDGRNRNLDFDTWSPLPAGGIPCAKSFRASCSSAERPEPPQEFRRPTDMTSRFIRPHSTGGWCDAGRNRENTASFGGRRPHVAASAHLALPARGRPGVRGCLLSLGGWHSA
ncbi:hypothetical protein CDO26_23795 (plasmid) [Sinorhizobium meliloti]|nr:hypothetical protein CDO26_23795 [Sinorhizobium meliloti]RVG80645.1 hypothetical protein CN219_25040 [Sinorhizobium meliloti]RVI36476.1 hypothetical protein CN197_11645 [Sinorhizobium meliloti]RVI43524.1 hypothetical protein CN196_18605 [Sinorhizobium meliloti]RVJ22582.1 hypothetical protein CN177_19400 [Sinorhizobium meliloti]